MAEILRRGDSDERNSEVIGDPLPEAEVYREKTRLRKADSENIRERTRNLVTRWMLPMGLVSVFGATGITIVMRDWTPLLATFAIVIPVYVGINRHYFPNERPSTERKEGRPP